MKELVNNLAIKRRQFFGIAAMLLLIDNYDSFTFNLVQYFRILGQEVCVFRNDAISIDQINKIAPDYLVISPGPGIPKNAGITTEAVKHFAGKIPILGVCLGHQAIAYIYGGTVQRALLPMHGKSSLISHSENGLFDKLKSPIEVGRYHSLIVDENSFPECLKITARTIDGEIMALEHKKLALAGIQFHPESVLTPLGLKILSNFLINYKM